MELHFCDICNESVPQSDLDQGRAFVRHGRVVCAQCESAMSPDGDDGGEEGRPSSATAVARHFGGAPERESAGSRVAETPEARRPAVPAGGGAAPSGTTDGPRPEAVASGPPTGPGPAGAGPASPDLAPAFAPPPPPPRAGVGGLVLVGLMATAALAVSSVVTVILVERIQDARAEASSELVRAERRLSGQLFELESTLTERRDGDRADRQRELESLRAEEAGHRTRATARLDAIDAQLQGLQRLSDRIDDLVARLDRDREATEALSSEVAQVKRDVGVLAERWMEALATGDVAAPGKAARPAEEAPAWLDHARGLESPSAATRWSAVTALGETRDPRVVPHLLPMLEDPDIFVRMATARILGDLASDEAIGSLIDALEDEEGAVREAVVAALRSITGENFKFDPYANETERARRVKAWRDWHKKSGRA